MNWKLFAAVSTMTGMIIGAGYLAIPGVVSRSGFLIGFIQMMLIGFALLIIKLYLGEILLRTPKTHQLPGLAKLYLGKWGGRIMFFSMLFGVYSASIAYLIGEGESFSMLFFGEINNSVVLIFGVSFWLILSIFVYHGLRALKKGESIGLILVLITLFLISVLYLGKIKTGNLSYTHFSSAFIPVGVIMFAFLGFSAIPEALRELKRNEKLMKKAILLGAGIPIVLYVLFTLIVVGFSGKATPEIATFALGKPFILLGMLTIFTAYFALTMAMRDVYRFDLGYSKLKAWLLASLAPLILFLIFWKFNLAGFSQIIGFTGAILGVLIGVMVLLMVKRARKFGKRKPEYVVKLPAWVIWVLIVFLVAGLVFQVVF